MNQSAYQIGARIDRALSASNTFPSSWLQLNLNVDLAERTVLLSRFAMLHHLLPHSWEMFYDPLLRLFLFIVQSR
jgi:hypothetical protein